MVEMKIKKRGITLDAVKKSAFQNKEVQAAYEDYSAVLNAARMIKVMRRQAGLTQAALAEKMGVSQTVVGRLETATGKRGPTMEMMTRAATACNYHVVLSAEPGADYDEPLKVNVLES